MWRTGSKRVGFIFGRQGFTLVEMLVVLAIVSILSGLLVMGIMSSREAGRRTTCVNNLRQQTMAALSFESAHGHLPSNGWGNRWIAISGRGNGTSQPGGWTYLTLPFAEEQAVYDSAPSFDNGNSSYEIDRFSNAIIPYVLCQSRPMPDRIPVAARFSPIPGVKWHTTSRCDYAINGGAREMACAIHDGPESLSIGDSGVFKWPNFSACDGVTFYRSAIRLSDILDGTSHVIMLGEKQANTEPESVDEGMNQPMFSGDCLDTRRWTTFMFGPDEGNYNGEFTPTVFGSSHGNGCGFGFCDGSVQVLNYSTDGGFYRKLGGRKDGN